MQSLSNDDAIAQPISCTFVECGCSKADSLHSLAFCYHIWFTLEAVTCRSGEIKCTDDTRCIPSQWRCDNQVDCPDRSDEMNCGPIANSTVCSNPTFMPCSNQKQCFPKRFFCDGEVDCVDGSDESTATCGGSKLVFGASQSNSLVHC